MIFLFKRGPTHKAEMMSRDPKHKKAVMCLLEKMYMLDKFYSGMSYNVVGSEFSCNKQYIGGVFK